MQQRRQIVWAQGCDHAQAQFAGQRFRTSLRAFQQAVRVGQQQLGLCDEGDAPGRWFDVSFRSLEQDDT
jgi:hypothetical protein